jgi:hypothetical protein
MKLSNMLHGIAYAFPEKLLETAATIFLVLVVGGMALISPHNQLPCRGGASLEA